LKPGPTQPSQDEALVRRHSRGSAKTQVARNEIKIQRNEPQIQRNKNQARRNEIKIQRNNIKITKSYSSIA